MALERWDPFREMMSLREAMNRLFEESWIRPTAIVAPTMGWVGAADLYETDDSYQLEMSLPGVRPEDVEITAEQNTISIRGEIKRPPEQEEERRTYHIRERRYGTFHRSITLPTPISADQVEATFDNGLLMVRIPKAPEARPRRIQVRAAPAIAGQQQQPRVTQP